MGGSRAQISVEYLIVAAFGFLLLTPIIIIAYTESARFSSDVTSAQIRKVGVELVDTVDAVYYAGPPAKRTVRLYFPDHVQAIDIQGTSIVFTLLGEGGVYEYAVYTRANVTGSLGTFTGVHVIEVEASGAMVNVTEA